MKVPGRRFAAIGFIACLEAMAWACGSRSIPTGVSVPSQPTHPPEIPSPVTPKPEPPPQPPATAPPPETSFPDCALIDEGGEAVATVGVRDRIDPSHAPYPSNDGERLLFRQIYETLIEVACGGHVRPGLAASWRFDANGGTWIVTLRENARFSDGTPVTSNDVRASWSDRGELRPRISRFVESIAILDDRRLAITLKSHRADAPLALAHTDLAIAKETTDSPWPLGTRTGATASERAATVVMTDSVITLERDGLPSIRFLVAPGDPRDLLDNGVDLMLTRDPAALDYAATLPHFQSLPLEWHRIYVLLAPGRPRGSPSLSEHARQVLAVDAVRGEARGAAGPFWWAMLQECDLSLSLNQATSTPRVVYDARDNVARDLAERLVGLARGSDPAATAMLDVLLPGRPRQTYERAIGLTGEPLARARRLGTDAGYIMSFDRRSFDACRDVQSAMDSTPWLDPETIVPLVETRLRAIVRRGRSGITAQWDGGLLIETSGPNKR